LSNIRKKHIKKLIKIIPKIFLKFLPDRLFVKLFYYYSYGKFPDLKNPRTFDEKLQWYKLYYRKPEMTILADKFEVRSYVEEMGLGNILNELYFVKSRLSADDLKGLSGSYVIKATHGCGMNVVKVNAVHTDNEELVKEVNGWLKLNHYYHGREWAYKNIKPRVICEKYLENKEFGELIDYKFYCYGGKPEVVFACAGRFSEDGVKYNAYDMDWNRIYTYKGKSGVDIDFQRPDNFNEMKEAARVLSGDYPFIRVDLYSVEGKTVFGELTFYPDSGIVPFSPDEFNFFFGDLFIIQ